MIDTNRTRSALVSVAATLWMLQAAAAGSDLAEVVIVGTAPLSGGGIDPDKLPGNVQTIDTTALDRNHRSDIAPVAAARSLSSVTLTEQQGNPYQPDFVYRGFEASPVAGIAQGLAVYQNGTRINEAFGDTVNWDLIPQFAIQRLTVQSGNPAFGLNALGGAVTLDMKNGNNAPGADLQLSGGSERNLTGFGAYGMHVGAWSAYGALGGVSDEGFRYRSETDLRQAYADIGYEARSNAVHFSATLARNAIAAFGPVPAELLAADRRAIFTSPQSMGNQLQLFQLNATHQEDDVLISANLYRRHYVQRLVDGNTSSVATCSNNELYFCLEGAALYPLDALHDEQNREVPVSVLPSGATPGELDRTETRTTSVGVAIEAALTAPLFRLPNHLTFGAALDSSTTRYSAYAELATLLPSLQVVGSQTIIDQSGSSTASPPLVAPVDVRPATHYRGLYFADTLDLTKGLAATLSARFNAATIVVEDLSGSRLNGSHSYQRVNPGFGFTQKLSGSITVYAGYSQSNRVPTAGEVSCADPAAPCLLDAFLVSDPPLKQVVAHTLETGVRSRMQIAHGGFELRWNAGAFRTVNSNDILLIATDVNGFGFFTNVGSTRRQGFEAGVAARSARWTASLNYSLIDATFRENLVLASNSPAADNNGDIFVTSGDRLPLTPRHRVTVSIEFSPLARITIGADARFQSAQYLAGDESNQEPPLASITLVNAYASWQLSRSVSLFATVENMVDRRVYSFGSFTSLDRLPPNVDLSDPRAYSPSAPRLWFGGFRLTL